MYNTPSHIQWKIEQRSTVSCDRFSGPSRCRTLVFTGFQKELHQGKQAEAPEMNASVSFEAPAPGSSGYYEGVALTNAEESLVGDVQATSAGQ